MTCVSGMEIISEVLLLFSNPFSQTKHIKKSKVYLLKTHWDQDLIYKSDLDKRSATHVIIINIQISMNVALILVSFAFSCRHSALGNCCCRTDEIYWISASIHFC